MFALDAGDNKRLFGSARSNTACLCPVTTSLTDDRPLRNNGIKIDHTRTPEYCCFQQAYQFSFCSVILLSLS